MLVLPRMEMVFTIILARRVVDLGTRRSDTLTYGEVVSIEMLITFGQYALVCPVSCVSVVTNAQCRASYE